jgi:hypothetical protein
MVFNYKRLFNLFSISSYILLLLTFICFFVTIIKYYNPEFIKVDLTYIEEYSEKLNQIKTLNEFKLLINSEVKSNNLSGIEIPIIIDEYIRNKFYHGTSFYEWNQNWVLAIIDYFLPNYEFKAIVNPRDIFKKNYAMCSQQSIIFQEIIKDYEINYGSVRFLYPAFEHFANAVEINNDWFLFDTNFEPQYNRRDSEIFELILSNDLNALRTFYQKTTAIKNIKNISERKFTKEMVTLTDINKFPASNGLLFHKITYITSWFGWLMLFVVNFLLKKLFIK